MAYVNEEISKADYEKYNLDGIEKNGDPSDYYYWAIDRERGIWLREYYIVFNADNRGEEMYTVWGFCYKDYLMFMKTKTVEWKHHYKKKEKYVHKRLLGMFCPFTKLLQPELPQLPEELEDKKEEILKEFKKALEYSRRHLRDGCEICKIDLEYNGEIMQ